MSAAGQWLAALKRGAADAQDARIGAVHGLSAPSATPYLERAFAHGSPGDCGLDMAAARPLSWAAFQRICRAGVPGRFLAELAAAGDILAAKVTLGRDGGFAIGGPDGRLLLAVRDEVGALADVIAFRLDGPRDVASWFGDLGGGILGRFNLPDPGNAARVCVCDCPLEWLKSGGAGLCVYNWSAAVGVLRGLGERVTLEAPPALASVLRARMERGGLPLVASAVNDGAGMSLAERIGRAA